MKSSLGLHIQKLGRERSPPSQKVGVPPPPKSTGDFINYEP
ncbi:MAG TPA: hypothetical protein V6D48_18225 [Oculatellaceae cyanobacterium]